MIGFRYGFSPPALLAAALLSAALPARTPAQSLASVSDTADAPAALSAPAPALMALAGTDGFGLRSTDGGFQLRFQGVAQYEGRSFREGDTAAAIDGFEVRRLRTDVRGTVYSDYDFRVNLEYAGGRLEVLDANLDARFHPALQLRAGKFKVPFGLERLQGASVYTFAERGYPTSLAPNRDVGVQVQGLLGGQLFTYQVGVFNGVTDGGSADLDVSDDKDVAGRVFLHPFAASGVAALEGLGVGVAATVGDQTGTAAAAGLPQLRTTIGRTAFLRYAGDGTAAGTVVADGRRTRLSPQGYWYWGNAGLLTEFVRTRARVRRGTETGELDQAAWQVAASWVVTGEPTSYRGVVPARAFAPGTGGWGAWEIAARVQGVGADEADAALLADAARASLSATGYTVGFNWYLNRVVRFLVNYEHTEFEAAPGTAPRGAEGVLVSRVQVAF